MLKSTVLACAGLVMISGIYCQAQTTGAFRNIMIKPQWGATPLPGSKNYPSSNRSGLGRWYMIKINYTTPKVDDGRKKVKWLDDITMNVEILFPGEYEGKQATARMSGSVEFWSIPLDGKVHNALMLVPPQIIQRYARVGDSYKRIPIFIKVSFLNSANRLMAVKYYSSANGFTERAAAAAFAKAGSSGRITVGGILKVGDVILSRDKTPWSSINWEHYELIKPQSAKK